MLQHEPRKHYAKWRKTVTKGHILCDSICMKCPAQANPETESVLCYQGSGDRDWGMGKWVSSGDVTMFWN